MATTTTLPVKATPTAGLATSGGYSPPAWLNRWLEAATPGRSGLKAPQRVIDEAKRALPIVRQQAAPAEWPRALNRLKRLLLHFPTPKVAKADNDRILDAWFEDYQKILGHLPLAVIEDGCARWLSMIPAQHWFPKPAELLDLIVKEGLGRGMKALELQIEALSKATVEEPWRELTEEEKADFSARIGALRSRFAASTAAENAERDASNQAALDWYKKPRPWTRPAPELEPIPPHERTEP